MISFRLDNSILLGVSLLSYVSVPAAYLLLSRPLAAFMQEHPYAGRPAVDDRTYGLFAADVKQQLATDAIMPETIYAPELPALEKTLRKSLSRLEEFSSSSSSDTSAGKSAKVPEIPAIVELRQALKKQV